MLTRENVFALINDERAYQDECSDERTWAGQSPVEQLALIEEVCRQAKAAYYARPEPRQAEIGEFMRKIGGVAVRCMEEHGAPARG